ncbi:kinase-like domain-containing protein, partial [Haematococcus lacustris]
MATRAGQGEGGREGGREGGGEGGAGVPGSLVRWQPPQGCEWELDPSRLELGQRIAVGGFAEVFVGRYEGTVVAVKRLLAHDADTVRQFVSEIRLLARLRHPHLILFIGYTRRPEPCIVSEYMAKGSLFSLLRQRPGSPPDSRLQKAAAVAVARGMAYLHSRTPPILHLDLKTPNILVDAANRIKIADFGLSTVRQATFVSCGNGNGGGTPEWMAPEVLRSEPYAEPADVYSYGVVLWELLTGLVPWADYHPMQVVGLVGFQHRSLPLPQEGPPLLLQLCAACLNPDPACRPTFSAMLQLM